MSFLWAKMLWLLILLPLLVGAYTLILRRKRKAALSYASLSIVREALRGRGSFKRHLPPLLALAATAMMIVALARPSAVVTLPTQRGTVILAMDISGSMRANDIEPNRMEAAVAAARAFIAGQPRGVRIGVVAFAATASVVQPPTAERTDIVAALSRFHVQLGTAVGAGILTSLSLLFEDLDFDLWLPPATSGGFGRVAPPIRGGSDHRRQGPRELRPGTRNGEQDGGRERVAPGSNKTAVVVLLSDGQTNTGPDPMEAAAQAADLGVRVFTVGLGTTTGDVLGFGGRRMRVQLDEKALKGIAERTGARYYRAGSGEDLKEIYAALSTQLTLERDRTEITAVLTAAALALMLAALLLSLLWFGRLA